MEKTSLSLSIRILVMSLLPDKKCQEKDSQKVSQHILLSWTDPAIFFSLPREIKLPEVQQMMSQPPPPPWFHASDRFCVFQRSKNPWIYLDVWLYVMLLHTRLYFHLEANVHLLTP